MITSRSMLRTRVDQVCRGKGMDCGHQGQEHSLPHARDELDPGTVRLGSSSRNIAAEVLDGLRDIREHRAGKRTLKTVRVDRGPSRS